MKNLIGKKVIVFIDQAGQPFKYSGQVIDITKEFLKINDEKLGNIHLNLDKIITIKEEKNEL